MPSLTLIAGANGSGKSTFVRALSLDSIDPDRIAAGYGEGFTPSANLRASREALRLIEQQLQSRQDLTLEVTLASSQPLRLLERAGAAGYRTRLVFVTPGLDDTRLRIDNRVLNGGHNIPDDVLERRGPRILAHLPEAMALAELSAMYLSSRSRQSLTQQSFQLVAAAHEQVMLLMPDVPAEVQHALSGLPPGWPVKSVQTVPEGHPASLLFGPLIEHDSQPPPG